MFPVDTTILPSIKSTGGEAQVDYSSSSKIDDVFGKLRNLQAPKTTALSPSFPVYLNQICPFWKLRNLQRVHLFVFPRICVLRWLTLLDKIFFGQAKLVYTNLVVLDIAAEKGNRFWKKK